MNAHDCVAAMLEHMSAPSNKNHIAVRAGKSNNSTSIAFKCVIVKTLRF